jgi:hypothetical protein
LLSAIEDEPSYWFITLVLLATGVPLFQSMAALILKYH